nr:MAG TPA: IrrE N-terminal-like domain [Caudoviricetes sp.]
MNIILLYKDLPYSVSALTHENDDGSYTIMVNSRLTHKRQINAVIHELQHISVDDFTREEHANLIENLAHQKCNEVNLNRFEFFIA